MANTLVLIKDWQALLEKPNVSPIPNNWNGPYIRSGKKLLDPWGNLYQYENPGRRNRVGYDLYSYGKDGQEGGEGDNADIGNW